MINLTATATETKSCPIERATGTWNYSPSQIPLIHIVDEDDRLLLKSSDAEWYRVLYYFPDKDYREVAAKYYDALYDFNQAEALRC